MKIAPYLMFNGEAEAAANFYAGALGGKIGDLCRYEDFPSTPEAAPLSEEDRQRIGHCCISVPGGGSMGLADTVSGDMPAFGSGHMLSLSCESAGQAEAAWAGLSVGARKIMCPLQETFYAKLYGALTDKFGVQWGVMYEK